VTFTFWKLYVLELLRCVQLLFVTLRHVTFTYVALCYVATSYIRFPLQNSMCCHTFCMKNMHFECIFLYFGGFLIFFISCKTRLKLWALDTFFCLSSWHSRLRRSTSFLWESCISLGIKVPTILQALKSLHSWFGCYLFSETLSFVFIKIITVPSNAFTVPSNAYYSPFKCLLQSLQMLTTVPSNAYTVPSNALQSLQMLTVGVNVSLYLY
jgi:hypothetical protein